MKRLSALALCALALLVNACEKHPASRLPDEHATQFGQHGTEHHGAEKHAPKSAAEHHAPATPATPAAEAKPGEAPKFFPEKK
jgi:hypothetical protein